ncbi:MAG: PilW family protein [Pseudomonadota bacterium]
MKNSKQYKMNRKGAQGFSLLELMISLVLGMIIIGGAATVYLGTKQSFNEADQVAKLSENGRFALQLISNSVRHINFFGGANPADIRQDANLDAIGSNCTGDAAAFDTDNSMFAFRTTSASAFTCITDAVIGTDVLVIKGVEPAPVYDDDPNDPNDALDGAFPVAQWDAEEVYLVANSEAGLLVDGADTAPDVGLGAEFALGVAWPYRLHIFYVRNNAFGPTLARKTLVWDAGGMIVDSQDLVHGVENLRFLFGYSTTSGAGNVDTLSNAAAVTAANAWDEVTSLQAFILLRSESEDPSYTNEKTYQMAGESIPAGNDNFRRVLLHSQIVMRNPRLLLRGGA